MLPVLETALRIFPQHGSAIVTMSGEVLTGNGILYGGASSQAANSLLERKNQVTALDAECGTIRGQIQQLTERRQELCTRIEAAQAALDEAREEKQSAAMSA